MLKLLKLTDSPIKQKIILLALFSTLIPLLVIGPFTFILFNKAIENKVSSTITNFLTIADWNIDTFITEIEDISNSIFLSNDIHGYLTMNKVGPRLFRLETASRNTLNNITVVNKPFINSIYIGNEHHGLLKVNRGESLLNGNAYQLIKESSFYNKLLNSPWKGQWFNGQQMRLVTADEQPLIYGRMIKNLGTEESMGVLLISIDSQIFNKMFDEVKTKGNILILDGNHIIYSRNSMQISSIQLANIIDRSENQGTIIKYINGTKNLLNYHTNKKTGWKVVSIIPYNSVVQEVNKIRIITISLLVIGLIISIIFAFTLSKKITKQLGLLRLVTEKMEKREIISGVDFNKEDEIGKIGDRFVEIYNRNIDLTFKLYESKIKEKEAELMALQSHINPHFLYNTLNTIYWMAIKIRAKPIAKIAISLSKIFKLTLNDGSHVTTVQNEIDQVKSYLDIQNIRFDHKITYHIDVEPSILERKMIKLLLQPIIENAVYHGLEQLGKGTIMIKGYQESYYLLFEISDTGKGFDCKTFDYNKVGYALKNINERLKLCMVRDLG
ncbi:sensor histidine kinase [Metabacillus halosaccharovorans]|uniref:Histidine kinase n=1 Tax=Metabacillus halosaccharovorans TaxID=930124 RepID=A0ABT3DQC2_9BACI|nr:sensor histidine kinase [Metabacillus halosaccharovorans]MCV9888756.1 histidine kinase [Metabacillus halosaccharovorans]